MGASIGSAVFAWLLASPVAAQTYQYRVLHSFSPIGSFIRSTIIADTSGNFYATTSGDGPFGYGTVLKLDAASNYASTILHSFDGLDGRDPNGPLVADSSGNLYGTTSSDGPSGFGTVFRLDAANNYALTTLHTFGGFEGRYPDAGVVADASGDLYGTTAGGGFSGFGTVFKLDAANNYALTTLHDFDSLDGAVPLAALIADASGNLYGTTAYGGIFDSGTVFKLDAANNFALTTLHEFDGFDGNAPEAALIADASGNLYGTTSGGSNQLGTVFMLDAANNFALTTLHTFGGNDGAHPHSAVLADASGSLYGTTEDGGLPGFGTVFKLDAANGYSLTTLHTFLSYGDPDGARPRAAVIADASGNLYGTTTVGGEPWGGTAFKLDAANDYSLTTLYNFNGSGGRNPEAAVIADAAGNLYGTTSRGGFYGGGTIFRLDAASNYALTTIHDFEGLDGAYPSSALVADAWGNFYGTAPLGGAHNNGTIFRLDAANNYALTTLHSFDALDPVYDLASVIVDDAGNLYGTTHGDGTADFGTVFKLDAANNYALTTLHTFNGFDGGYPEAGVVADASGNLYGTTWGGGISGYGIVFELEAANDYSLRTLHSFEGPDGQHPVAPVMFDAAGNLYGTSQGGGASGGGTVFRLNAANDYALTTLHDFNGLDGAGPSVAVIADASGNLYGTTRWGSLPAGGGTVFKLDAANDYSLTVLHSFVDSDGLEPRASLNLDSSGNLFGTASWGGANGTGVVFALLTGVSAPATGIAPTSGPAGGGTVVTITGSGFAAGASVWIGGAPASGVAVVGPTEITATTPPLVPGQLHDVAVTNATSAPSGPGVLAGAFFSDFLDVPQADIFHADVEKVFRSGITAGCGGGQYCRNSPVSRAQMAVLLLKGEHGAGYVPPSCAGIFGDVPCPSQYADWIEQLSAEGITAGCGSGNYCPGSSVTRAQMAVFLLKSEHGSSHAPPACVGIFGDVLCPSLYADWIEQLSSEGITGGCSVSPALYCPAGSVNRGQMAAFLTRTFGLALYGG